MGLSYQPNIFTIPATYNWYSGNGIPSSSLGNNSDFYLDLDSGDIYTKKTGVWVVSLTLKGIKGDTGEKGDRGATWFSGSVAPDVSIGLSNDYYLNTTTYDVYSKATGAWELILNLKGAKGDQGEIGATGAKGDQGERGNTIFSGVLTPPTSDIGIDGDYYLNTSTHLLYGPKTSNEWGIGVSLVGPAGAGSGDMSKSIYDTTNRGYVDRAVLADKTSENTAKTPFIPAGFTYAPPFRNPIAKTINHLWIDCIDSAGAAQNPTSLVITIYGGADGTSLLYTSSAITTAHTSVDVSLSLAAGDLVRILTSNTTGLTGGISITPRAVNA